MQDALAQCQWERARALLHSASEMPAEEVVALVQDIVHSGCLVLRNKSTDTVRSRDGFLVTVLECIRSSQDVLAFTPLAKHLGHVPLLEEAYATILEQHGRADISRYSPSEQVWAAIERACVEIRALHKRVNEAIRKADPTKPHSPTTKIASEDGNEFDADSVTNTVAESLFATLHMLSYREHWLREGKIVIPARVPLDDASTFKSGANMYFAIAWLMVKDADDRLRYFGGDLKKSRYEADDQGPAPEERFLLRFEFELGLCQLERIARSRLDRIALDVAIHTDFIDQQPIRPPKERVALPPDEFVSADEVVAFKILRNIYHFPVEDERHTFGQLSIRQWLRAYSLLKERYAVDSSGQAILDVVEISEPELSAALELGGLSAVQARAFVRAATLSQGKRDLYDAPLLEDAAGSFHFLAPIFGSAGLWLVVASQVGCQGQQVNTKGSAFHRAVLELFREHQIPAKEVRYSHEGREYDCDVLVLWNRHLFVIECKNHIITFSDPARSFHFWRTLEADLKQCKRTATHISRRLDLVRREFGPDAQFDRVHPMLLNAMPFSIAGGHDGVHIYDYSALNRFFRKPYVTVTSPVVGKGGSKTLIEHRVGRLWKGDDPSPDDLLSQMDHPIQLAPYTNKSSQTTVLYPISHELGIEMPVLQFGDANHKDFLRAVGFNGEAIQGFEETSMDIFSALRGENGIEGR